MLGLNGKAATGSSLTKPRQIITRQSYDSRREVALTV